MVEYYSLSETAELVGKSKETLRRWDRDGILNAFREPVSNYRVYRKQDVQALLGSLFDKNFEDKIYNYVEPQHEYKVLELFAGAGGLAVGLEKSGLKCIALNEIDRWACQTLRKNRPNWKVLEGDIKDYSFSEYRDKVDVVTGGLPCQAFSYAGKKLGLNDARGTLFYEFAINRIVNWQDIAGLLSETDKTGKQGGRKPISVLVKAKMLFVQYLYNLSDPELSEGMLQCHRHPPPKESQGPLGRTCFTFPKGSMVCATLRPSCSIMYLIFYTISHRVIK